MLTQTLRVGGDERRMSNAALLEMSGVTTMSPRSIRVLSPGSVRGRVEYKSNSVEPTC